MFFIGICLLLAGCGTSDSNNNAGQGDALPEIIEAKLNVPEKADAGKSVDLAVTVTQGKEAVEDASEVKFEIWKDGNKDQSVMAEAAHTEKGIYTAKHTFTEDGVYEVQSHVTARDMHTMPKVKIQIGDANAAAEPHDDTTEEDHHHSDVSIHLQEPEHLQANQAATLVAYLQKEKQPLSEADVQLEIVQDGKTLAWVDMTEGTKGEYTGEYQFPAAGKYSLTVHVKNDEGLHEHTEQELEVHS
jgi:hypothetical protein